MKLTLIILLLITSWSAADPLNEPPPPTILPPQPKLLSNCPGGCVHVITSIFCDHVLEEATCEENYLRCCVPSDFNYGTPVETSPPLGQDIDNIYTSSSVTPSSSDIVLIKSNHHVNLTSVTPFTTPKTFSPWTTSTTTSTTTTTTPKPTLQTQPPLIPSLASILTTLSSLATSTSTAPTTAVTNRMSNNITTSPPTTTTPSPLMDDCDGTCIAPLFTFLCDEISEDKYCPSGGTCCFNKEVTTTPAPIPSCPGNCIPIFFSGAFCNRPNELIPKTSDCMSGTICCADRGKEQSGQEEDNQMSGNTNSITSDDHQEEDHHRIIPHPPPRINRPVPKPLTPPSHPPMFGLQPPPSHVHQMYPPKMPGGLFSSLTRDIMRHPRPHHPPPPVIPSFMNGPHPPMMRHPHAQPPPNIHLHQPPVEVRPIATAPKPTIVDPPQQPLPTKGNQPSCPSVCVTPLLKFTCFGSNILYPNFQCPSPEEVCCVSIKEVQAYEASVINNMMQENKKQSLPQNNPEPPNFRPQQIPHPHHHQHPNHPHPMQGIRPQRIKVPLPHHQHHHNLPPIHHSPSLVKPAIQQVSPPVMHSPQPTMSSSVASPPILQHLPPTESTVPLNSTTTATTHSSEVTSATIMTTTSTTPSPPPGPIPSSDHEILPSLLSSPKTSSTSCGIKGLEKPESPRIVGGRDALPGEFCWQVALINAENQYLCGGALIGAQWVMTAAHCITGMVRAGEQIYIRVGDHDLTNSSVSKHAQTMKVSTTYIHHNHNGQTLDNDIALLKMDSPVNLDDSVCLVCLPSRGSTYKPGKRCTVTGYGYVTESGPIALKVRAANVPIVDDQDCAAKINAVTDKVFILPTSSFCAGGSDGNDSCQGDGGGPLVCQNDGYYEVTGLVSWGFGCGRPDVPAVYVKVSAFIGWINQVISVNH